MKRLLHENVDCDIRVHNSRMTAVLLIFKNTPDYDIKMSPTEYVFSRPVNDMLLTGSNSTDSFADYWKRTMATRELAVAGRHEPCHEKLSEHIKALLPLQISDHVAIQNQHGNHPLKWDKCGVIVSVDGFNKYGVKVLGSGCLTHRNSQFLRQYTPDLIKADHGQHHRAEFYPADYSQY